MVSAVVKKKAMAGAALLALLLLPARGGAHPEVSPQLVNRYLSVIVVGDRLEYFVTFLYGPLPAVNERKAMDADGDGAISAAELEQATARWKARAGELASATLDGQPLPFATASASLQLGPDQTVGPAPLVVEIYGSRPLAAGTRQVRLEPGWEPERLGETELSIDVSPDWELVSSHQGQGPEEKSRRYLYEGRRPSSVADRSATFVLRSAAAPTGRRPTAFIAAAIAALAGVGLALELRRRQRAGR
jgi:hypothetical protein